MTTMPVLCLYRVWSAYKDYGHADGAKMIHVARLEDVPYEFEVEMRKEGKRGAKFFGVEYPSRWILKRAVLRDGTEVEIVRVGDDPLVQENLF